jgi:hypothetical protein
MIHGGTSIAIGDRRVRLKQFRTLKPRIIQTNLQIIGRDCALELRPAAGPG